MENQVLEKLEVYDSFIFLYIKSFDSVKKISLSFSFNSSLSKIIINFNEENSFIKNFRFNALNINDFLLDYFNNKNKKSLICIEDSPIPF